MAVRIKSEGAICNRRRQEAGGRKEAFEVAPSNSYFSFTTAKLFLLAYIYCFLIAFHQSLKITDANMCEIRILECHLCEAKKVPRCRRLDQLSAYLPCSKVAQRFLDRKEAWNGAFWCETVRKRRPVHPSPDCGRHRSQSHGK